MGGEGRGFGVEAAVVFEAGGQEDAFDFAEAAAEAGEGVEGAGEERAVAAGPDAGVGGGEHPGGEGVDVVAEVSMVGAEEDVAGGHLGELGVVVEEGGGGLGALEGRLEDKRGERDEAAAVEAEGGAIAGGAGLAFGGAGPGGFPGVGAVSGEAAGAESGLSHGQDLWRGVRWR